jgi:Na+/H+-dicarboxylate symporter
MSLATRVLIGLVAGLVVGLLLAPAEAGWTATAVTWIEPIGGLWVNAIRMTVIPLLVSLLLAGIVSSGTKAVAGIGGRAVAWFIGMVAVSSAIAAVFAPPLLALLGTGTVQLPEVAAGAASTDVTLPPFRDWFVGLLPANPVAAAAEGAILPLVLFTVVFGLAATRIASDLRDRIVHAAQAVADTMFVIIEWILAAAPVGIFALTLDLAARTGASIVGAVGGYILISAVLVAVATVLLYPMVGLFGRVSVRRFAQAAAPAQAVGFSTRSSLATLPILMEEADKTLELPPQVAGLALPAAVSVFKYSSPIARLTGTFFVAALFGINLGPLEMAALAAGVGALSFYSPGIPSGGLFVMAPLYQAFGLPIEGIGILVGGSGWVRPAAMGAGTRGIDPACGHPERGVGVGGGPPAAVQSGATGGRHHVQPGSRNPGRVRRSCGPPGCERARFTAPGPSGPWREHQLG